MNSSPAVTDCIRAEQIAALFQNVALDVLGATAAALVLAVAVWQLGALDPITASIWLAACA